MSLTTTDNLDEIFDIVDFDDNVIGQATRKECNSNPRLIHRAVFILVYNNEGKILWQKRSLTKDVVPGQWVTSASGHVMAGDSYDETAARELEEELGITARLTLLGKFLFRYRYENEFSAIFKANANGPFKYNEQEISECRFMSIAEMLKEDEERKLKLSKAVHYIVHSLSLL